MNIWELIKHRFPHQKHSQAHLYAALHKVVIDTIWEELDIEAWEYIDSVKLYESKLFIKTRSSLISEEIQNISGKIEQKVQEKLENLWKKLTNLDIIVK